MTKQDKVSLLLTFTMGFVSGVYLYFSGYSLFSFDATGSKDFYNDFRIVGETYNSRGICKLSDCLSFEVATNGEYTVISYKLNGEEVKKTGFLESSIKKDLEKNLKPDNLKKQAVKSLGKNCKSDAGKEDYNLKITLDGKTYELDTCKTQVDYNSQSWSSLARLWNYFKIL